MKELGAKYWQAVVIALLIGFIGLSGMLSTCSKVAVGKVITQANVDNQPNVQKHKLDSAYLTASSVTTRKLQIANKTISDGLKPVIKAQKADSEKKVAAARKDTNMTVSSDSAMTSQERYVTTLERNTVVDSTQIKLGEQQELIKDSMITKLTTAFQEEVRINTNLTIAITKANKGAALKWWFLGAGVVLTAIILK